MPAHLIALLVSLLTFGVIGSLSISIIGVLWSSVCWIAVALLARSAAQRMPTAVLRVTVAATMAWVATMLGVLLVTRTGPDVQVRLMTHPAFGEHPVRVLAGWPWNGIEGNGQGAAMDRIPFDMGVDALLVNFTAFLLLLALAMWRKSHHQLAAMLPVAAGAAVLAGWFAGFYLGELFD